MKSTLSLHQNARHCSTCGARVTGANAVKNVSRNRSTSFVMRSSARETERSTRDRSTGMPPPPPPPPPPPGQDIFSAPMNVPIDRRDAIIGGVATIGVVIGTIMGLRGGRPSADYERELSYVASQVGVRGMPSPDAAIVDRSNGKIVGISVVGPSGQQYVATVDQRNPSVFLLKTVGERGKVRPGMVYRLPTRYEKIDLGNRRLVESVFRIASWERMLQ